MFDENQISPQEIRDGIDDLGYPCTILEENTNSDSKITLTIGGMSKQNCANRIESHVMALRGIESCTVSLPTSTAVVEFVPAGVGPRDIINLIQSLGYTAELATHEDRLEGNIKLSDYLAELPSDHLGSFIAINNGCFVLRNMVKSGSEKAKIAVIKAANVKTLKKSPHIGAKHLMEELNLK
uniref:HMA domain-containing protein n=1 Tax=Panagrolaimus davidi TaxID=227884 RepID=A0A914QK34_9BILA